MVKILRNLKQGFHSLLPRHYNALEAFVNPINYLVQEPVVPATVQPEQIAASAAREDTTREAQALVNEPGKKSGLGSQAVCRSIFNNNSNKW